MCLHQEKIDYIYKNKKYSTLQATKTDNEIFFFNNSKGFLGLFGERVKVGIVIACIKGERKKRGNSNVTRCI